MKRISLLIGIFLALSLATTAHNPTSDLLLASDSSISVAIASTSQGSANMSLGTDNYGFDIDVDLSTDKTHAANMFYFPYYGTMRLALYTSETMLSTGCFWMKNYRCEDVRTGCKPFTDPTEKNPVAFSNFNGAGYRASASIALDVKYWELFSHATIVPSCSSSVNNRKYNEIYGLIGMGISDQARKNLKNTNSFAIYIDSAVKKGNLHFQPDPTKYAEDAEPIITLPTNSNWQVTPLEAVEIGNMGYKLEDYHLMFDLNNPSISLPPPLFDAITQTCLKGYSVTCPASTYSSYIVCAYAGEISSLPDIVLYYKEKRLKITPKIYATEFSKGNIKLWLNSISPAANEDNYVSPDYYNYIALGSAFMKHHYTVFDASSTQQVKLYKAKVITPDGGSGGNKGTGFVVFMLVTMILSLFICYKKFVAQKGNTTPTTASKANEERSYHAYQDSEVTYATSASDPAHSSTNHFAFIPAPDYRHHASGNAAAQDTTYYAPDFAPPGDHQQPAHGGHVPQQGVYYNAGNQYL